MANGDLEQRVAALEGQTGGGGGGGGGGGSDPSLQAFLAGALTAYAASQQGGGAQGIAGGSGGGGAQGIFGWNPTKYDSFFWCKSRFMCNPQSVSCLC
jgi:hypothetical protein